MGASVKYWSIGQAWDGGLGSPDGSSQQYWFAGQAFEPLFATGIAITGTVVVGASSVLTGGVVELVNAIIGTMVVGGSSVLAGGTVQLAHEIIGGVVVPSTALVITPGGVVQLAHEIIGTVTIPSTAAVLTGGALPVSYPLLPVPPADGHGMLRMPVVEPNEFDRQLERRAEAQTQWMGAVLAAAQGTQGAQGMAGMSGISGMTGLGSVDSPGNLPRIVICGKPVSDHGRRQFFERGSIVTPTTVSGNNVVVEFRVPMGYHGVILGYYALYGGTGFVQGSGDIIWRLKIGGRWEHNFGQLLFSIGSFANPLPVQQSMWLESGQLITMYVNVPNTSGLIQIGTSRILCGLQGWFYPQAHAQPDSPISAPTAQAQYKADAQSRRRSH